MSTLAQEVAAGAKLLDAKRPGWEKEVNVENICMWYCTTCVLGMLYGHYFVGLEQLALSNEQARPYGFTSLVHGAGDMKAAWIIEINKRRDTEGQ